jgi:very-short-patch-repair endonuclease/predicted transcriptional regulator of viral defense system
VTIERSFDPEIRGGSTSRSVDRAITRLANRQQGVVLCGQLLALGLGAKAIDHRVARGVLHVIHRGVYAVGHRVLTREGRWMAAVLAAGPGAVLSHRSAAALWGIWNSGATIEVTVARRCRRPGIHAHRIALPDDEVTTHRGIPVTTPARTLLDLAEHLTPQRLERAVHEAEYRRLTSPIPLEALLTRHPRRRGTAALRTIVDRDNLGHNIPKTELETAFIAFLDTHALPRPRVNEPIGPYTVDALWPQSRLIVELDSRSAHHTTKAFEDDRARDRDLQVRGYNVLRITWRHLHEDEALLATQLGTLLAA